MCFLPADLADLPLVKFDFSCNKVSTIPVCYRKMKQLQSLQLENNPLQSPPAQVHTFISLASGGCCCLHYIQVKKSQSWLVHTACNTFLKTWNWRPCSWGGHVTWHHHTELAALAHCVWQQLFLWWKVSRALMFNSSIWWCRLLSYYLLQFVWFIINLLIKTHIFTQLCNIVYILLLI